MKEYKIEVLNKDVSETAGYPIGWVQAHDTKIFTDWVKCAVAYTQTTTAHPDNRYRIVCRNVDDWEECYR